MTSTTTTQAPETTTATRATWKQHGNPTGGFEFFGTQVKAPNAKGIKVVKVEVDPQGVTLKTSAGRVIDGARFGTATKFWAIVPADAPRQETAPKGTPAAKAEPLVITAPIGGTQTVAPVKDAIDKAIKATGKSIMAISREHGLNPSQMRRLSLNQVAKVDLVRAEAIAKALGRPMATLFGGAVDKAKAAKPEPKATAQDQAAEATQDEPTPEAADQAAE